MGFFTFCIQICFWTCIYKYYHNDIISFLLLLCVQVVDFLFCEKLHKITTLPYNKSIFVLTTWLCTMYFFGTFIMWVTFFGPYVPVFNILRWRHFRYFCLIQSTTVPVFLPLYPSPTITRTEQNFRLTTLKRFFSNMTTIRLEPSHDFYRLYMWNVTI